jgi:nitric oxide dioxygenase
MSANESVAVRQELAPQHAEVVTATLPLIGAHIDEITTAFYRRLFINHPELLRNLFNRGNQSQGAQQRALAASIATFATHLVDPTLPHPAELLSRIGHKHASLGVTADKYPIVYEHLFAGIVEVLGADTVTADVAAAWTQVYWIMAETLIDLEHSLYSAAGVADGDVFRQLRVVSRVDDPSGVVRLSVRGDVTNHSGGQYISVGVTMPDGARQLRQYSLVNAPGSGELSFVVKPVGADANGPAGEVSNWIKANVWAGDLIDVTIPFGDLPIPAVGAPVVLISAGIGITPMISILETLLAEAPNTAVRVLHADHDHRSHPLRDRQRELVAALPNATLDLWYEAGVPTGKSGLHTGFLTLEAVEFAEGVEVYLCGSNGFVQAVRAQLTELDASRVHCELFSPDDWLLS